MVARAFTVMMRIMTSSGATDPTPGAPPVPPGPRNAGDGLTAVRHLLAMALLAAVLVSSGGACSYVFRERMCVRGERAVRAIEAPDTGRTCVKNGQPPPPGYEEFPPGQRPYVDQDR